MTAEQIKKVLRTVGEGQLTGCSLLKNTEDACREAYLYIEALEYALTHDDEGRRLDAVTD